MGDIYGEEQHHTYEWDAEYSGMVWIHVAPNDRRAKSLFLTLSWGDAMCPTSCPADADQGVVLFTQKDRDETSARLLHVLASRSVKLSFGTEADVPDAAAYYDLNNIWENPGKLDATAVKNGEFWREAERLDHCYSRESQGQYQRRHKRIVKRAS